VLARWRNFESASGLTAVLARWYDFQLASGLTPVLDHWRDVKSATELTRVLTRWSLARQQVGGGVESIAYSSLALLALLARWLDKESAAGWMAVLARWHDFELALGLTAVLAHWRDSESAAGLTAMLLVARWRDNKSGPGWTAMLPLLARWVNKESAARRMAVFARWVDVELVARRIMPQWFDPMTAWQPKTMAAEWKMVPTCWHSRASLACLRDSGNGGSMDQWGQSGALKGP
jgi:hypothetical protein